MKWENLQTNNCPYCSGALRKADHEGVVKCDECNFRIVEKRLVSIRENRRNRLVPLIKMKWQNLKKEKCPMCGDHLRPTEDKYDIMKCINSECTFKIRADRMMAILEDTEHPCNRFPQK